MEKARREKKRKKKPENANKLLQMNEMTDPQYFQFRHFSKPNINRAYENCDGEIIS